VKKERRGPRQCTKHAEEEEVVTLTPPEVTHKVDDWIYGDEETEESQPEETGEMKKVLYFMVILVR